MDVQQLKSRLDELRSEALEALQTADRLEDAIQIKNRYLGRKGHVQDVMKFLRDLPPDGKREIGQASNQTKKTIEEAYETRVAAIEARELAERLERERVDVTLPGRPYGRSSGHPIRIVEQELISIFTDMGFEVADGPEIEEDYFNFEALNFPPDHPARDMQDTFLLEDGRLLRTHTSPVQIRTMLAYDLPVRVISPGRVYRCDHDVTHSPVFHQIEGLLVDRNVTFRDLKGTLEHFLERLFGSDTEVRFRPSYFPFTEPSAEVDIGGVFGDDWMEILGCGMVDPNVLSEVGIDPDVYSGFAFGIGVERVAMLRYEIPDIRMLFGNDLRFLRQF
jgi:phenylalanyl-tRNA synthetase alpha chain